MGYNPKEYPIKKAGEITHWWTIDPITSVPGHLYLGHLRTVDETNITLPDGSTWLSGAELRDSFHLTDYAAADLLLSFWQQVCSTLFFDTGFFEDSGFWRLCFCFLKLWREIIYIYVVRCFNDNLWEWLWVKYGNHSTCAVDNTSVFFFAAHISKSKHPQRRRFVPCGGRPNAVSFSEGVPQEMKNQLAV